MSGYNEDKSIPKHVFSPIISMAPTILNKRDCNGVLKVQTNLLPILSNTEIGNFQNVSVTSIDRNGQHNNDDSQIESIIALQVSEVILPQISALNGQPHVFLKMNRRKKPRKQLLSGNRVGLRKIVGNKVETAGENVVQSNKEYPNKSVPVNNNDIIVISDDDDDDDDEDDNYLANNDINKNTDMISSNSNINNEEKCADENVPGYRIDEKIIVISDDDDDENGIRNDMKTSDNNPANDNYVDENNLKNGFDRVKLNNEVQGSASLNDENSSYVKVKNKQPVSKVNVKNDTWHGKLNHFQKYTNFKIKKLTKITRAMRLKSACQSEWKIQHFVEQFDEMINTEQENIETFTKLRSFLEVNVEDPNVRCTLVELIKANIQKCQVTKDQLKEVSQQLTKIFENKTFIEEIMSKYFPD